MKPTECAGEGAEYCGNEGQLCDAHHEEAFKQACLTFGWPYPPVKGARARVRVTREDIEDAYGDPSETHKRISMLDALDRGEL